MLKRVEQERQVINNTQDNTATFTRLSDLIAKGGKVSTTRISEEFTWDNYLEVNKEAVPLFLINTIGQLSPFTPQLEKPIAGEMVVAMQPYKMSVLKDMG